MPAIDRRTLIRGLMSAAILAGAGIAATAPGAVAMPVAPPSDFDAIQDMVEEARVRVGTRRRHCWWHRGRRVCRWRTWRCWWHRGRRVCGWR